MKNQPSKKNSHGLFQLHYLSVYLILFLFIPSSNAHSNNESDKMYVHLDKGFYVAGERIYYTIFQSNKFLNQSIHLKVSISNSSMDIIDTQFIETKGKLRQSDFIDLPFQLPSGYYNLTIQAFDQPTKSIINLAEISIPVYSDFEPMPSNIQTIRKVSPIKKEQLNISLKIRNPNVAKRSKVEPIIQIKDKRGRFVKADISMSVSDVMTNVGFENLFMFKIPYNCTYLGNTPFFEGVLKQKRSLRGEHFKTILPKHQSTSFTKTNCGDQTVMTIKYDNPVFPINSEQYYILYDSLIFIPSNYIQLNQSSQKELIYTDGIVEYIKASKIRRKINLHYKIPTNSTIHSTNKPYFTSQLFWKSGEYTRFKSTQPSFYFQSDDRSEFQIELVARDESGNIGRKKIIYTVY